MPNNLIVTLKIEANRQVFFEEKRKFYYPNYCNFVPAHLTYFHAAPNNELFLNSLKAVADIQQILMETECILPFNNGMAYAAKNDYLQRLHAVLQQNFIKDFSGKDRKIWKPHITIQNKVTTYKAKKNYQELSANFEPFTFKAEGFNVYEYANKKWVFKFFIPFQKL